MSNQTHPLILVAATSATVASLAAVGYFTGLLPTRGDAPSEPVVASAPATPAPAPIEAPAATPAPPATPPSPSATEKAIAKEPTKPEHRPAPRPAKPRTVPADRGATPSATETVRTSSEGDAGIDVISRQGEDARPAAAPCRECGTIDSVQEIRTAGEGSGLGAIAGGILGGLLGNQIGKGSGRDVGAVVGAVGGAVAGHQVEKNMRAGKRVEVTVRMDDGTFRSFDQEVAGRWHSGDRVRIEQGRLLAY